MRVVNLPEAKPDEDLIRILSGALARAQTGETVAVVMIEQKADKTSYYSASSLPDRYKTIGYLSSIIFNLHKD